MRGRVASAGEAEGKVLSALDRRLDRFSDRPLALGLSGGGDSAALLFIAARWARQHGRPLIALHLDHGLSPKSGAFAWTARSLAVRVGAGFELLKWRGAKPGAGLQEAARNARHRLLAEAARRLGAQVVLLAHSGTDVLEGEIIRRSASPHLGRLAEWGPSPAWPEGRSLFLLRPCLTLARSELRACLGESGAAPIEDPANDDLRFARTRARRLIEAGPVPKAGAPYDPSPLHEVLQVREGPAGELLVPASALAGGGGSLLGRAVLCASGRSVPPSRAALERALEAALGGARFTASLSGARLEGTGAGDLVVRREAGEEIRGERAGLRLEAGGEGVFDGRFLIRAEAALEVRLLRGLAASLPAADRRRLRALPAPSRPALPCLRRHGATSLPSPFGEGPGRAAPLGGDRLLASAGLIASESDISRKTMAKGGSKPYVDDLCPKMTLQL